MSGYIYLASPYSSRDAKLRAARYKRAVKATATLMERGEVVFCPIAYGHSFEDASNKQFPYEYWIRWSRAILAGAAKLYVLTTEGWDTSVGVREEVTLAHSLNIPVVGFAADESCEDVTGWEILGTFGLAIVKAPRKLELPKDSPTID